MRKSILRAMTVSALVAALLPLILLIAFSNAQKESVYSALRDIRVTYIDENGGVIFDNISDAGAMANHLDRPEVEEAIIHGFGEDGRVSETTGQFTRYYAYRASDGIFRVAITDSSAAELARGYIFIAFGCLVAGFFTAIIVSQLLTRRLVAPINNLDLDEGDVAYEELMPFVRRLKEYRARILKERAAADDRSAEITYITEHMREGIILVDGAGAVLLANKSVLRILGAKDAVGRPVFELTRDPAFMRAVRSAESGIDSVLQIYIGERLFSVSISHTPPKGAVILFVDDTDKQSAERQRREFSANVSHELKTPLTTIRGLAEMIESGAAKQEDVLGFAAKISKNTQRLTNIVDDVIRLAEFDEGRCRDDFSPFDIRALADSIAESLSQKAKKRGVSTTVTGQRFTVSADRGMFDEMLYNLVDNAIKYNKEGGSVTIGVSNDGTQYSVFVSDTGIGIPKVHIPHVFERFYRVDKSRSRGNETSGTGLGLSIVKHIAEFHGGRVSIESAEGAGTKVTCVFIK